MSFNTIQQGRRGADIVGAHFTQIFNGALRDPRLSAKAKFYLTLMMSYRVGFAFTLTFLVNSSRDGRDAVVSALRELEKFGYLSRTRQRDPGTGKLLEGSTYDVTDMPDGQPGLEKHLAGLYNRRSEPETGFPEQVETGHSEEVAGQDQERILRRRSKPKTDFPPQGNPAQGNPLQKKTTFEEDQVFGADGPAGVKEDLSSSSSRLRRSSPPPVPGSAPAAWREDEEDENSTSSPSGTTAPAQDKNHSFDLGADGGVEEGQRASDDLEVPSVPDQVPVSVPSRTPLSAPVRAVQPSPVPESQQTSSRDLETLVDALPWPIGHEPGGQTRKKIISRVSELCANGWLTADIRTRILANPCWKKEEGVVQSYAKMVLWIVGEAPDLPPLDSVSRAAMSREMEKKQLEAAMAPFYKAMREQYEQIDACGLCDANGYRPQPEGQVLPYRELWCGHGDVLMGQKLVKEEKERGIPEKDRFVRRVPVLPEVSRQEPAVAARAPQRSRFEEMRAKAVAQEPVESPEEKKAREEAAFDARLAQMRGQLTEEDIQEMEEGAEVTDAAMERLHCVRKAELLRLDSEAEQGEREAYTKATGGGTLYAQNRYRSVSGE